MLTLTCQHSISHEITDTTYDAVICGTGYDRKSWLRLLCASNLADDYLGLAQASDRPTMIKLAPQHHIGDIAMNDHGHEVDPDVKYELVDYTVRNHNADHHFAIFADPSKTQFPCRAIYWFNSGSSYNELIDSSINNAYVGLSS